VKTNTASAAPAERRQHQRREVDFAASVRFSDGTARPCRVKNISPMGALIDFGTHPGLPAMFRLIIASELFSADCELRHETGHQAGVLFTSSRAEALAKFG
jgi:PilZ domain